jgi:Fe-S oxidoreductase
MGPASTVRSSEEEKQRDRAMTETIREAVGAFENSESLDAAVYSLETRGFDRAAFSLLASEEAVERKLGHRYRRVKEVEDDPGAPRGTFFSLISRLEAEFLPAPALAAIGVVAIAGIGTVVPVLVAAGTGALLGAALGRLMHERHARIVAEQIARGGILLWVNVRNADQERTALEVLRAHSAHDIHVHDIAAPQ